MYIFAGYPPAISPQLLGLLGHAGAARAFIIQEAIGLLEERAHIQWQRDGIYIVHQKGEEWLEAAHFVVSPALQSVGFHPQAMAVLTIEINGQIVRLDSSFQERHALGNAVSCNARVGMIRPLPLLDRFRDPLHTNPDKPGRVINFRLPKYERNIWLSWAVFQHFLPFHTYIKLLTFMEGPDTMFPSKEQYEAMLPNGVKKYGKASVS